MRKMYKIYGLCLFLFLLLSVWGIRARAAESNTCFKEFQSWVRENAMTGGTFTLTQDLVFEGYYDFPYQAAGDFTIDTGAYSIILQGEYGALECSSPNMRLHITGEGLTAPVIQLENGGTLFWGDALSVEARLGTALRVTDGFLVCSNESLCHLTALTTGIENESGQPLELWNLSITAGHTGIVSKADVTLYGSYIEGGTASVVSDGTVTAEGSTLLPAIEEKIPPAQLVELPALAMDLPVGTPFSSAGLPGQVTAVCEAADGQRRTLNVAVLWDEAEYTAGIKGTQPFTVHGTVAGETPLYENAAGIEALLSVTPVVRQAFSCQMELFEFNGENHVWITFPEVKGCLSAQIQISKNQKTWTDIDISDNIPAKDCIFSVRIYDDADTYIRLSFTGSACHGYTDVQIIRLPGTEGPSKQESIDGNHGQGGARENPSTSPESTGQTPAAPKQSGASEDDRTADQIQAADEALPSARKSAFLHSENPSGTTASSDASSDAFSSGKEPDASPQGITLPLLAGMGFSVFLGFVFLLNRKRFKNGAPSSRHSDRA